MSTRVEAIIQKHLKYLDEQPDWEWPKRRPLPKDKTGMAREYHPTARAIYGKTVTKAFRLWG